MRRKDDRRQRLADAYNLVHYRPDRLEREHAERLDPRRHRAMARWAARSLDETWVDMPPENLAAETLAYSRERFELILADVLVLGGQRPVLAEGFQLDPASLAAVLDDRRRAVWLVADEAFRRAVFFRRDGIWDTPSRTSDPERAQANRIARDVLASRRLRAEAAGHGFAVIDVTTETPLDGIVERVEAQFAPFLGALASPR